MEQFNIEVNISQETLENNPDIEKFIIDEFTKNISENVSHYIDSEKLIDVNDNDDGSIDLNVSVVVSSAKEFTDMIQCIFDHKNTLIDKLDDVLEYEIDIIDDVFGGIANCMSEKIK